MGRRVLMLLLLGYFSAQFSWSQRVWVEPKDFSLSDSLTVYVDVSKSDWGAHLVQEDSLYFWTWLHSPINCGSWDNSLPSMAMHNEGNGVWSFTMIPTALYDLDSLAFEQKGWDFLVKAKDGGTGRNLSRTENFTFSTSPFSGLGEGSCYDGGMLVGQIKAQDSSLVDQMRCFATKRCAESRRSNPNI